MRRCMAHSRSAGSRFSGANCLGACRWPQAPRRSTTSRNSSPAAVSRYSRPRAACSGTLSITPASSSSRSRWVSKVREISGIPLRISENRREPEKSSRRINGVQRSAKISEATATGQNWP